MAASELALFDLDNTLLSGDSDYEWAQFLIERGVLERSEYEAKNDRFFRQYKAGRLDIHEFLDFQLAPLARHPRERARPAGTPSSCAPGSSPSSAPKARELVRAASRARATCARSSPRPTPSSPRRSRASSASTTCSRPSSRCSGRQVHGQALRHALFPRGQGDAASRNGWASCRRDSRVVLRRAGSTATRTTTCRCSSASRRPVRGGPRRSPARRSARPRLAGDQSAMSSLE